jgi:hypothetical protein
LLQEQCAHISHEDQSSFQERLVRLKIRENESVSSFLKRFTYAKTSAVAASNTYSNDQLVDFVLAGIRSSKQDVYRTALQLYRLECLPGTKYTLHEIEQNFFQIDEGLGRDKRQLLTEHAMAAGGTYRGRHSGCSAHRGRACGRGAFGRRPHTASAHAVQQQSGITCYKCGEPGHIATSCPTNSSSSTSSTSNLPGQSRQRPRTAPPARGHAAAAQEGESSSTTSARSNAGSSSRNAMVCMARAVAFEQAMSAWRIVNYNLTPTLRRL